MVRRVVVQTLLVVVPPALLLSRGRPELAGKVFWVALGCILVRLIVAGARDELLCVLLAGVPFLNLLRGFLFFNVVAVVLTASLIYWFGSKRGSLGSFVQSHDLVPWLALFFGSYYILGFYATGRYETNFRMTECLFGAIIVLVLARRHELLNAAFAGLLASACVLGAALIPYLEDSGSRLGMFTADGISLGNPTQLGLPLSLMFVVLLVDRGAWIGLKNRGTLRVVVGLAILALLLLTTSRASWAVAVLGVVVQLMAGRRARIPVLVALLLSFVTLRLVLSSSVGSGLNAGLQRTFSEERSTRNRTSGRSDQWIVAYHAWTESARSLFFGQGAGTGPQVYARKSLETKNVEFQVGNEMALHSVYMQIMVELGLAGLLPFAVWLFLVGRRTLRWTLRTRLLLPLTGLLAYMTIASTVSGNDVVSGAFLGLGLLGASSVPVREQRTARPMRSAPVPREIEG